MKLKFISLFLALGMFVLGSPLMADAPKAPAAPVQQKADEPGSVTSVITSLICTFIQSDFIQQQIPLPSCCTGLCSGTPDMTTLGQCAATIFAFYNNAGDRCTNYPTTCAAVKQLVSSVQGVCNAPFYKNPVCTTAGCSVQLVRQACGEVCCNMGAGDGIKNCLGSNSDACSTYTNVTPCFSSAEATDKAAKAGW